MLQRVKTHLELRDKTNKLQESHKNIRELMHVLTHDLKNPLSGVKMAIEVIKDSPESFAQMSNLLETSLNNCFNIMDNVRSITAVEDGKLDLKLQSICLKRIIQSSLMIFQEKLKDKNIKVELCIPEDTTIYVEPNSFTISIFNNIFSNAIKFSYPDSTIKIQSENIENHVLLRIIDQGIGMPKNILKNIFGINKVTNRKGTKGETGTGYGMPLVKKFITAVGGNIQIESEEEKGTTVSLFFPLDNTPQF